MPNQTWHTIPAAAPPPSYALDVLKKLMKTFIVHGHDQSVKYELKDYLQNSLGLPEPIILDQKASKGMTVIEKFEHYAADCDIAFSLFTPDDAQEDDSLRARENVVFEYGYFLGKWGRKSGRVFFLHKGKTNIPSDLQGVIYINISEGIQSAGEKIRIELDALNLEPKKETTLSDNYKLVKTARGDMVYQSTQDGEVYICPHCKNKNDLELFLPAPSEHFGTTQCPTCKTVFKINPARPRKPKVATKTKNYW